LAAFRKRSRMVGELGPAPGCVLQS
jgi:hypothetical protein